MSGLGLKLLLSGLGAAAFGGETRRAGGRVAPNAAGNLGKCDTVLGKRDTVLGKQA